MENEIICINHAKNGDFVYARELHNKLNVTERFNRWFESLLKYGFEENIDFWCVKTSTYQNQYGGVKELDDYRITINMAKEICMLQRTKMGKLIRLYFIEIEKRYNEKQTPEYKKLRIESKETRKGFTNSLKNHGCTKPAHYINITNSMKKSLGINTKDKKDDINLSELAKVRASEALAEAMLINEFGYYEVKPVCVNASEIVQNAIENKNKKQIA